MKHGLRKHQGLREDSYVWLLDQCSFLPARLVPGEGLSGVMVWGWIEVGALLHRGNNQARHCWGEREYTRSMILVNHPTLTLLYIQEKASHSRCHCVYSGFCEFLDAGG